MLAEEIKNKLEQANTIAMFWHQSIDWDAIWSMFWLWLQLEKLWKNVSYFTPDEPNINFSFLPIQNLHTEFDYWIYDLIAFVDFSTYNMIRKFSIWHEEYFDNQQKIIIDHHRKVTDYIEDADISFHEVYASSAAELVTEIIQYAKVPIELSLIEAEGLYGGIVVDTKDFTFKTGVRTFEAAAFLRKFGVDIIRVKKWFQADLESYNTIAEIVRDSEIINDSIAISVYNNYEDENANIICAKAADELLTIADVNASFVLGKIENTVFISGRSIGDINVQIILEKLGGGGHITLAGAQLEDVSIEEAKKELISRIEEYFDEIE